MFGPRWRVERRADDDRSLSIARKMLFRRFFGHKYPFALFVCAKTKDRGARCVVEFVYDGGFSCLALIVKGHEPLKTHYSKKENTANILTDFT